MWWWLTPVIVLGAVLVLFGLLVFLGRFRDGALLRPLIGRLSKIGFMRRLFVRLSTAALERQNPELANAMRKISSVGTNPQAVQKAMSRLTPAERRAYMQATEEQGAVEQAPNRQARRRVERMQQQARSASGGGLSSGRPGSRKRKKR